MNNSRKSKFTHACLPHNICAPWLVTVVLVALSAATRASTPPAALPFSPIGTRAAAGYQGDALEVAATAGGALLHCGFQELDCHATSEGLWLESTEPSGGKLRLIATALYRPSVLKSQPSTVLPVAGTVSVSDKLVRFIRPGLTEEYSVTVEGLRQDFVIAVPPTGAGDLRVELALSGAQAEATAYGVRLTLDGSGRTLAYSRLRVEDATGRELTARLQVLSTDRLAVSVADANATYPVRIDPTFSDADWVSLGSGMNGSVLALEVSGTNLYAGGYFNMAGGVTAYCIAKWDGSGWSALGSGMGGYYPSVNALAVIGTNLYAGGGFEWAGEGPAYFLAKWDGSAWSSLGLSLEDSSSPAVCTLAASGTDLYVGGYFDQASALSANNIGKWDGTACSTLGGGMGGYYFTNPVGPPWITYVRGHVDALAVSGTNLYAGGYFNTAGGVIVSNIAKWDGSSWSALGSGMTATGVTCPNCRSGGEVYALAVSGTNLYAGGTFTTAGGVTANCIAKWDGSSWSALGSGMGGDCLNCPNVRALAVSGTNLYAGGNFITAGGVPATNIAKWDGTAWSALGSGVASRDSGGDNNVWALATDEVGHLFVGGGFYIAGTNLSPCIAQANLPTLPTILTPPQTQTAEAGDVISLSGRATGYPAPAYQWLFNGNVVAGYTNYVCCLAGVQATNVGTYSVVANNGSGAVTSSPAMLNVIARVERRLVPGVRLTGASGSLLNVDYADALSPMPAWNRFSLVNLGSPQQYWFDLTTPLPTQRFYRAWQTGAPGMIPSLDLHMVPAITLTGNISNSLRLDYINRFGPTDAWATLDTVTLTNTSQLYFDITAAGAPPRLYRLVPLP